MSIWIRHLVEAGVAKRETASRYLAELAKAGVLTQVKSGRDKVFMNRRLLVLLTEPSERGPTKLEFCW